MARRFMTRLPKDGNKISDHNKFGIKFQEGESKIEILIHPLGVFREDGDYLPSSISFASSSTTSPGSSPS